MINQVLIKIMIHCGNYFYNFLEIIIMKNFHLQLLKALREEDMDAHNL